MLLKGIFLHAVLMLSIILLFLLVDELVTYLYKNIKLIVKLVKESRELKKRFNR
ncbi:hypothetical protein [Clostridium sp.]|uniref:hypothetical protein n=1 Tax=Clostridium sp. TaxID=1506 RepID=UPI0029042A23|nr:hypothetical protein [Clostridium sp.]MDU2158177.1 hypothetical protein [Clostridium sp.]